MVAGITASCTLNSFGDVFQKLLLEHKVRQTKLAQPPLFVLGHWRSGTTLLHELLILDSAHTYPTTYECFVPHHFPWTEWIVPPLIRWLLPGKRPMDNMQTSWDRPQEDEFALCNLGIPSPYLEWAFPNHGPTARDYLDLKSLTEEQRDCWKRELRQFVQRVATVRNRRIVLKSPPHTARIRTILEVFPDARFVHIVRDPLVLFPSTVRLWKSLSQVQGLQVPQNNDARIETEVLQTLRKMYKSFEQDRALVPAGRLLDVRYEELVQDPKGQMERIYDQLQLGQFARIEPALDRYVAQMRDYRTNQYTLPPEVAERVQQEWKPYFERYGYRLG